MAADRSYPWLSLRRTLAAGLKQSPVNGTFAGMSRPRGLVPPAAPSFGLLT
jgi:hypothetical protein